MSKKISSSASSAMAAIILLSFSFSLSVYAKIDKTYEQNVDEKVQKGIRVEEFQNLISMNQNIVERRQEIEFFLNKTEKMPDYQSSVLSALLQEKYDRAAILNRDIAISITRDKKFNANNSEFKYLPHSDGSIVYFKAGQASRILNERVIDEFGNLSLKDTWDMKYNDRLLLTSYKSKTTDELGNVTLGEWQGAYTEDSVFYGNDSTNANKNMLSYTLKETDHAENTRTTEWQALRYDGKLARELKTTISDSVYGNTSYTRSNIKYHSNNPKYVSSYVEEGFTNQNLYYTAKRENITYNSKDQVTGYTEEKIVYDEDGSVRETVKTTAKFAYLSTPFIFGPDMKDDPDPDKLLYSCITTETVKGNGETMIETTTTDYTYNSKQELTGAVARTEFNGQEARWHEYTDPEGNVLTRSEDENGNVTYSYIDPETLETVMVSPGQVTDTVKEGNLFKGSSDTDFEIVFGIPMPGETTKTTYFYGHSISENELVKVEKSTVTYTNDLVNNIRRTLESKEHVEISDPLRDPEGAYLAARDIETTNVYDEKGNLTDVTGTGTGHGFEYSPNQGWYGKHSSTFSIKYDVILGSPVQTDYYETKDYTGGEE